MSVGWTRLAEEWQGVFWHDAKRAMLIVYVDDFKLAAPKGDHDGLWESIRSVIDMDPETLDGRFLGCVHERSTTSARNVMPMLDNHPSYHLRQKQAGAPTAEAGVAPTVKSVNKIHDPNRKVEVVTYNMERFAKDCVSVFCQLSGYSIDKVGTAPTPFLEEANDPPIMLDEASAAETTKGTEGSSTAEAGATSGKLSTIATKVLMKIMYIARFARPDLLRAVGALSCMITKWDYLCDR